MPGGQAQPGAGDHQSDKRGGKSRYDQHHDAGRPDHHGARIAGHAGHARQHGRDGIGAAIEHQRQGNHGEGKDQCRKDRTYRKPGGQKAQLLAAHQRIDEERGIGHAIGKGKRDHHHGAARPQGQQHAQRNAQNGHVRQVAPPGDRGLEQIATPARLTLAGHLIQAHGQKGPEQ